LVLAGFAFYCVFAYTVLLLLLLRPRYSGAVVSRASLLIKTVALGLGAVDILMYVLLLNLRHQWGLHIYGEEIAACQWLALLLIGTFNVSFGIDFSNYKNNACRVVPLDSSRDDVKGTNLPNLFQKQTNEHKSSHHANDMLKDDVWQASSIEEHTDSAKCGA